MRVVVVGGGIVGMFASYHLVKAGHSVSVVDGTREGCKASVYNAGLLTPSLTPAPPMGLTRLISACFKNVGPIRISPSQVAKNMGWFATALGSRAEAKEKILVELGLKSLQLYNVFFREESVEADVIKGVVALYLRQEDAKNAATAHEGHFLDRGEVSELGFTGFDGGVLFDEELSVNPRKLCDGLRKKLSEMGVAFIASEEAKLHTAGKKADSVVTEGEKLEGDIYVVATGSWSRDLCRPLGYDPKILPARGMVMMFHTGGAIVAGRPALLEDYGVAVAQHDSDTLRLTSFFELKGFNDTFSESRKSWMLNVARKHLGRFGQLRKMEEGIGYRPCTPDQLPVVGKVPGFENIYIAAGHCRLGVTLAPVTGYLIRALLDGEGASEPFLGELDPARFA